MQLHSVYLQRRRDGISYREFQRLWRSHGDFAATIPAFWDEVERYVHNDPVEDAAGLPEATARYDGVGELFYTSYQNWLAIRDVMWREVAPDEKRVFAGAPQAVRGTREVHQKPSGNCKLFTFARFRPGSDSRAQDEALAAHVAQTAQFSGFGDLLAGFTVTRALRHDQNSRMDEVAQTSSTHDVLLIHHFAGEAQARAALGSAGYARLECAQDGFLDWESRICLLTQGWVLKGELG